MKRKIIGPLSLIIVLTLLWLASLRYPSVYLQKASYTFLAFTASYLLFRVIFEELISKRIKEPKTKYSFRKVVSILYLLAFSVVGIAIWVEHPQALLVSYGVLAAGAAVAMQDFFKNFVGGIAIFLTGIYHVGDRIEINAKSGDVIDIGILYTTLLEINDWVPGDQATGRLSIIPNGYVLANTVNNYTKDHPFIWDEVSVPITYDSDWKEAVTKIVSIVENETTETADKAEKSISKLGEKYYLPRKALEPAVFLTLTGNWINLNIRYITEVRQRRQLHSHLSQVILDEVQRSESIKIASETMDIGITGLPEIRLKNESRV